MTHAKHPVVSVSPLTGKVYQVPDDLDDQDRIDDFLACHRDKPVVAVQGLGFVGAVMSLVCANALTEEYAVIGVDLPSKHSYWKICAINEGDFPVVAGDPKMYEFYNNSRAKANLLATYDSYAYACADVIIVDVNLDVKKQNSFLQDLEDFQVDMGVFEKAIEAIGDNCKEDVLILVETTVPPGTCEKIVHPIISKCLAGRGLRTDSFRLGHSYERVMPGPDYIDSIQNFYRVYSGIDEESADATERFLRTIISTEKYPLTRLGNTSATEMAKVLENSFRAMNIAFMAEWSRFAEEAGVNMYEIVDAIRMRPTHRNIMYPGLGVGGYCLPKDPLLASWSRQHLFSSWEPLRQSEQGVRINDKMPLHTFEFLQREYDHSLSGKRVLLLGVSYRSGVGDTRYSPVEPFYNYLLKAGCIVYAHDPHVRYWEEKAMDIHPDFMPTFEAGVDIIVMGTPHSEYRTDGKLMPALMNQDDLFILDAVGFFNEEEINQLIQHHYLRVIGRGDIQNQQYYEEKSTTYRRRRLYRSLYC
jgi:UDP-N-acetyl-D-glucosamine dehydrogenase